SFCLFFFTIWDLLLWFDSYMSNLHHILFYLGFGLPLFFLIIIIIIIIIIILYVYKLSHLSCMYLHLSR
ncbi:MAG: hypothetical protein N7Q72_02085, partial [Spiroplasma sp. Tabriz.8]|nr:hypothetical protein [Spiroplasma sp. Tabriz.8]